MAETRRRRSAESSGTVLQRTSAARVAALLARLLRALAKPLADAALALEQEADGVEDPGRLGRLEQDLQALTDRVGRLEDRDAR